LTSNVKYQHLVMQQTQGVPRLSMWNRACYHETIRVSIGTY